MAKSPLDLFYSDSKNHSSATCIFTPSLGYLHKTYTGSFLSYVVLHFLQISFNLVLKQKSYAYFLVIAVYTYKVVCWLVDYLGAVGWGNGYPVVLCWVLCIIFFDFNYYRLLVHAFRKKRKIHLIENESSSRKMQTLERKSIVAKRIFPNIVLECLKCCYC